MDLGGGREMWSGYNLTVRPTGRWKLMLNIDTSATGFYRHIPVLDFLQEILPRSDIRRPLRDTDRIGFSREIKGILLYLFVLETKCYKFLIPILFSLIKFRTSNNHVEILIQNKMVKYFQVVYNAIQYNTIVYF